jgi:DNA adenine methylase
LESPAAGFGYLCRRLQRSRKWLREIRCGSRSQIRLPSIERSRRQLPIVSGYLGSKQAHGAFQQIIAQMPPHDTYIETHLGGGAVMRLKPAAAWSIGVDLDRRALREAFQPTYPVDLHRGDAIEFLRNFDFAQAGRVLIYSDPPYLIETRTSSKRYRCEYTRDDHVALIETLKAVPAAVILSGYPSRLYQELLADWRTIKFQVMTRGGVRTEQLWMNFPAGDVHWATWAGKNKTRRQNIKRKAARWEGKFRQLEPGERLAVLTALLGVDGS